MDSQHRENQIWDSASERYGGREALLREEVKYEGQEVDSVRGCKGQSGSWGTRELAEDCSTFLLLL